MSYGLRRASIWIARLPPPSGTRPVVVLTRDVAIPKLANVTVAIVTSSVSGAASEVHIGPEDGLRHDCVISCDNVLTVPKRALERQIGELGLVKVRELAAAIRVALDV
jgi:mRNA interferase MazF